MDWLCALNTHYCKFVVIKQSYARISVGWPVECTYKRHCTTIKIYDDVGSLTNWYHIHTYICTVSSYLWYVLKFWSIYTINKRSINNVLSNVKRHDRHTLRKMWITSCTMLITYTCVSIEINSLYILYNIILYNTIITFMHYDTFNIRFQYIVCTRFLILLSDILLE